MTIAVDLGRKATKQTNKTVCQRTHLGVSVNKGLKHLLRVIKPTFSIEKRVN